MISFIEILLIKCNIRVNKKQQQYELLNDRHFGMIGHSWWGYLVVYTIFNILFVCLILFLAKKIKQ